MAPQWNKEEQTNNDPLALARATPLLGQQGSGARFLGRVIIELWETGSSKDDANNISYSAEPVGGDSKVLLQRVAKAFSARIQRQAP